MIFTPKYNISIPDVDVLSFLFSQTPFKDKDPIWIDPYDLSNTITLAEARNLTHRIGHTLRFYQIGANDDSNNIVLTFTQNQIMVAPCLLGVLCAGGIHSTCPATATAFELARQLKLTQPKVLICSAQTRTIAEQAISESGLKDIKLLVMVSDIGKHDLVDADSHSVLSASQLDWKRITSRQDLENRTACVVFSSGTTGIPKGKEKLD